MALKYAGPVFPRYTTMEVAEPENPGASARPFVVTVKQASSFLQLDPKTIRAMLKTGELVGNRRGHAVRINGMSVVAWAAGVRPTSSSEK